MAEAAELFAEICGASDELVAGFDVTQLAAIAEFLRRSIDFAGERAAVLRAQARPGRTQVRVADNKKERA